MITWHRVGHAANLELDVASASHVANLHGIVGGGRGCAARVHGPVAGVWIPLRGRVALDSAADSPLPIGEARVGEAVRQLHASGRGNAVWVAVLGSPPAWRRVLSGEARGEPALIPARHPAEPALRRLAIALARASDPPSGGATLQALIDRVIGWQDGFEHAIDRCPGRTYQQRRNVFVRLQRVRNAIASSCHLELDNDALARMASYSTWHFIRAFRAAYGQTPHALLVHARLDRAHHLLRTSGLSVAEISCASGFDNRCAFSRLFRQRFGMTASTLRRTSTHAVAAPTRRTRDSQCATPATRYAREQQRAIFTSF